MFFLELLREALRNLARHKLRSLLTTLGIVFGVASVLSMVEIGEGARQAILAQIEELGIRNIIINARKPPEEQEVSTDENRRTLRYGLTFRDARQIEETVPTVEEVLSVHDAEQWIWFKSRRIPAKVRGVAPRYFDRLRLEPMIGRTLTVADGMGRSRVCVVRPQLLREARYVGHPLKLDLKIGSQYFRVVGVLPDSEFQSTNRAVLGVDGQAMEVYVPFESLVNRFGFDNETNKTGSSQRSRVELHQIVCAVRSEEDVLQTARAINSIFTAFHKKQDYEIIVPLELLASQQKAQRVFNIVLPIIAGISLLVGGIGILNIMLASITERKQEIGIRRAIGASRADITRQFLIETVTLASIGGLIGVLLGLGGVMVLRSATQWHAEVTPGAIALAMGVSCLTGIIFGIYPARRAAAMNPIQALRRG